MLAVIAAAGLALLAWVYLALFHGGFWRTDQRLPPAKEPLSWPDVVAVVPARNEADILPLTLPTLLGQEYQGQFSVVLVDDQSEDGTGEVACGLGVKVVSGSAPPAGWAGKVWAMAQGVEAAGDSEYLLFTDADIAYEPGVVRELVASAGDRAMVSQMALLRCDTAAERLLIPAFVYFFAKLYPFRRVNRGRTAAAAGGCMLVRRSALTSAGGLAAIAGARIDDVALGTLLARAGNEIWLGFTTKVRSMRQYTSVAPVWDMVARSAYTQLRYSPLALAGTVIGLAWLYLLPPAATVAGIVLLNPWLAGAGAVAWAIMSATYLPMLRLSGLSAGRAPSLPLIAALYSGMTISSGWRHHAGRGGEWKGRYSNASGDGQAQTR
ncbi:MAG TPA: glycosyltransferase [Streptosporangiaceae bacterium]|nr:glycosyltransferase [Streptosporangiaceae bacterium]